MKESLLDTQKQPTMRDLAREAEVSIMTVSRVLDPQREHLVKPATRNRIKALADKLGVSPHMQARHLSRKKTGVINFAVPFWNRPRDYAFTEANASLVMQMIEGVLGAAQKAGYNVNIISYVPQMPVSRVMEKCQPSLCDGVLLLGIYHMREFHEEFEKIGIPHLIFNVREIDDPDLPVLYCDTRVGVYEAVNHLISCGHKRVAYLARDAENSFKLYRYYGYRDALLDEDLFDQSLVYSFSTALELRRWFEDFGGKLPFSAVCCTNDDIASAFMRDAVYSGLKVPEDIAIVGFDNNPAFATEQPSLATVDTFRGSLGAEAVNMLLNSIRTRESLVGQKKIPSRFVLGGSVPESTGK